MRRGAAAKNLIGGCILTNYKIKAHDMLVDVVEIPTSQTIATFNNKPDARKMMRFLNGGGGFNGSTPPFFLKDVYIKLKK